MLIEQVTVLSNILVVKIRNAEIKKNIQEKRKIEQREVFTICRIPNFRLHMRFNSQDPEWLDQEIEKKKDNKIGDELFLHVGS